MSVRDWAWFLDVAAPAILLAGFFAIAAYTYTPAVPPRIVITGQSVATDVDSGERLTMQQCIDRGRIAWVEKDRKTLLCKGPETGVARLIISP